MDRIAPALAARHLFAAVLALEQCAVFVHFDKIDKVLESKVREGHYADFDFHSVGDVVNAVVIGQGAPAAVEVAIIGGSSKQGDSASMPALKKQRGRQKMEFLAGLDILLAETSVCVVDEKGTVIMTGPRGLRDQLRQRGHCLSWAPT